MDILHYPSSMLFMRRLELSPRTSGGSFFESVILTRVPRLSLYRGKARVGNGRPTPGIKRMADAPLTPAPFAVRRGGRAEIEAVAICRPDLSLPLAIPLGRFPISVVLERVARESFLRRPDERVAAHDVRRIPPSGRKASEAPRLCCASAVRYTPNRPSAISQRLASSGIESFMRSAATVARPIPLTPVIVASGSRWK